MHFIHGSHGLESVSSSSLQPLPLASSLAPRHVPRTSPPPSPNASSTSQRHPSLRAQTSPPCPPLPPSASPCITVRPRRRRMLQPETETSYSQSYRASTLPEPTTAEESDTEETRTKTSGGVSFDRDAREACHKHMAQRTALRTISYSPASQATPHTVNCVCPARDSRTATPLVLPASLASTTRQGPMSAAASEPGLRRKGGRPWQRRRGLPGAALSDEQAASASGSTGCICWVTDND